MNPYNKSIKMPFAVSLTLIFAYSLSLILIPTSPVAEDAIAVTPDREMHAGSLNEQVVSANTTRPLDRESSATVH